MTAPTAGNATAVSARTYKLRLPPDIPVRDF